MKNKSTLIIAAIVACIAFWAIGQYNTIAQAQENVEKAWGDVESQYQRRADLINNLVATVKGYAKHEENTLKEVIEARAKATQITIDPSTATPEQLRAYQNAQGELSQAVGRLLVANENYPELKADKSFMKLQDEISGTENRCNTARTSFNNEAQAFNKRIVTFPNNIIANFGGFQKKAYFEADQDAKKAPKVSFD